MIMMISEEKVAEFKEQDDSLKNLVYCMVKNKLNHNQEKNKLGKVLIVFWPK